MFKSYSALVGNCSATGEDSTALVSIVEDSSLLLNVSGTEINALRSDQRRVGQSKKPAALQSSVAGQFGELLLNDIVVFEFFSEKRLYL